MLGIALGYHRMQFQRKRIVQTQENDKETHFGLIYARWSVDPSFFFNVLAL